MFVPQTMFFILVYSRKNIVHDISVMQCNKSLQYKHKYCKTLNFGGLIYYIILAPLILVFSLLD